MRTLWRKMRERSGQSLVEYALILALIAIVVIAALSTLGLKTANVMNQIGTTLPG